MIHSLVRGKEKVNPGADITRLYRRGIAHAFRCPQHSVRGGDLDERGLQPECAGHDCHEAEDWIEITYTGAVLCKREESGPEDSDFYCVVWDAREQKCKRVDYGSTRYARSAHVTVDATEEVKALAREWLCGWAVADIRAQDDRDCHVLREGRTVRVAGGNTLKRGLVLKVIKIEKRQFGHHKCQLEDARGRIYWTDTKNLEIVSPDAYRTPEDVIRRRAANLAERNAFYVPFVRMGVLL